ncbi:MAG: hypothetical protein M2R45_00181 [Verrucomicrobia subdivision 3 bacterium]|nr:hypothetical protein [Limisphaerales bacterium]MCS1412360.1 hypothetical protein [Limisphaerales bacterium]
MVLLLKKVLPPGKNREMLNFWLGNGPELKHRPPGDVWSGFSMKSQQKTIIE